MVEQVSVKAATPEQVINWVQLMSRLPAHINPLNDPGTEDDPGGGNAEQGDIGKIHYLAGTLGGDAVREFPVDLGDPLVLPILNVWEWLLENQGGSYETVEDAARGLFEWANPTDAWLKIDLNVVDPNNPSYDLELNFEDIDELYVESGKEFQFSSPKNNIYGEEPGVYDAYAVGYWAQINNLPEGAHKIEFGGLFNPEGVGEIPISVTDIITVGASLDDYLL